MRCDPGESPPLQYRSNGAAQAPDGWYASARNTDASANHILKVEIICTLMPN